jgi:phosphonate transport system substrate-binding protein
MSPAESEEAANQPNVTFGIVPQQSASKLAATWGPIMAEISRRSGVKVEFRTAPTIPAFEERLGKGDYDIAYMNPYHYVVFHDRVGYGAVAKEKNRKIQGIIVVRKDSPITSIEELQSKTLAFPAPAAFASSVLPRAALRRRGISFDTKYVASHDSVYFAVSDRLYPAGGGIKRTFETVDPTSRDQLRVLWTTNSYTPHAIAAHPRLKANVLAPVMKAMVSLYDDAVGKALLAKIGFHGIEPAADADWDDVRALDISPSDASGK